MTAPTHFERYPDYTGFLLHHCMHAMDLVPWLMGEPVASVETRRH
jgi:myo-inositol 2-dehydrogenase / D-chiro-inositol 1-dehydrogenase